MLRNQQFRGSCALFLGASVALSASAHAQSHLYTFPGDATNDRLGASVAAAGDVNGDGFPDLIAGAPEDFNVFALQPGYARVYSGKDGMVLMTLDKGAGGSNGEKFGAAVGGAGDINNDGFDDLIVGAPSESTNGPSAGEALVYSGANGQLLFSVLGDSTGDLAGRAVAGAGDINGDSVPDFIVGMPGAAINGSNSGMIRVFSGVNGSQLLQVLGQASGDRFGFAVDAAGDFDGDGNDDLLVGSYYDGARIISGADGSTLRHWTSAVANDFFGYSVRSIEDVTGDSVRDVIIGAIQPSVFVSGGKGYAKVYNAVNSAELHHFVGMAIDDHFGTAVDSAGDYDGDGTNDFLISASQDSGGLAGYVQVFSGSNSALLTTFNGAAADNLFGIGIAYLGDANGDTTSEFAIGEPHESATAFVAGQVCVESGAPAGCGVPSKYCTPVPNSTGATGSINFLGSNSIASNDLFLVGTQLPPNQTGIFYYGAGPNNVPYGNGIRCVSQGVFRLPVTVVGQSGGTVWLLDVTNPPSAGGQITAGSTWYFQYWHRDPFAGGSFTNFTDGLMVPFCP
jgi:FG-GAP repeat